ncbi:MAG: LPS export ABC transporter periplasmic protein LptC [Sheuella sp.]|jgi:lipopolysaccharide export system protein LptC|nr:LPS export ABC transporter periplasmic protein LptC [Sheuella sp.]
MKERFALIISVGILFILVASTWWAADYAQRAVDIDPPSRLTHEPDNWAKTLVLLRTNQQGQVFQRLEGDLMEHFPDDDSYEILKPRAFVLRPQNPLIIATSRTATIYENGDRIVMHGDAVILRMGDQERAPLNFRSDELTMLVKQDITYTDLPATAVSGRSRMSGVGMRYNNASQTLDVQKSTDVDIAAKDSRNNSEPAQKAKP